MSRRASAGYAHRPLAAGLLASGNAEGDQTITLRTPKKGPFTGQTRAKTKPIRTNEAN
jgi:hypothetical protein